MTTPRIGHTATLLNSGKVLITGGGSGAAAATAELYDPASGVFIATGSMSGPRQSMTLLNNGKVLITGGSFQASAELYDPAAGVFTATGSMAAGRQHHAATLLNNGTVLITGGNNNGYSILASAEVYDPAGGVFSAAGVMTAARAGHTATLLNGGKVLIAGGSGSGGYLASAELYQLATPAPAGLVSISLTPENSSISPLQAQQFVATGTFSDNSSQTLTSVTWSSSDTSVATITNDAGNHGVAIAAATGTTTITATAGVVNGSTTLIVSGPVLVSLTVAPPNPLVAPGLTIQFTATGRFSDGSTQDLTRKVNWTPSTTGVATVNSVGLAAGIGIGSTTVQATLASISGSTTLTVTPLFTVTGSMTVARVSHTVTVLNNSKVLITGGSPDGSISLASAELYDPATGVFSPTGSMSTARRFHTATLLNNGKVLITGGYNSSGSGTTLAAAELYDPVSGVFTAIASMAVARQSHTATLLNNGKVLVAGGFSSNFGGGTLAGAEVYDPAAGAFSLTGTMTAQRSNHTATLLNSGKVLITGGSGASGYLATAELYDPASGVFTATGSMTGPRQSYTATLLNNGKVLIIGGSFQASAELYDPAAGVFTATGSMAAGRQSHAATLLNNGTVLITGGNNFSPYLASAELYDPAAGVFSAAGAMTTGRLGHSTTLLTTGKVLIAGGLGASSYLASAELYQPSTPGPAGLVSISLTPANPSISQSQAQQFIATGTFIDGSTQTLTSVTWSSSNPSVAAITNDAGNHGIAFGSGAGTTTIAASAGAVNGSTTLTVIALMSIEVAPANSSVALGLNKQFAATGTYSDNSVRDLSNLVTWISPTPAIATINGSGLASAVGQGSATISATLGSITGWTSLTVNAPALVSIAVTPSNPTLSLDLSLQFTATGYYSNGSTQNLTGTVAWASVTPNVASISGGLAFAKATGTTTIQANSGPILGSTTLTVTSTVTFTVTGSMSMPRFRHRATLLANGKVLITGGFNATGALAAAELYDPGAGVFSATGGMISARFDHTATLLSNGKVLITGGVGTSSYLASAELYDPDTGVFSSTGALAAARIYHTATLLNDGKVLIAGGNGPSVTLGSAELYDPATGGFSATTGAMSNPRADHTATLLNDGRVLITGGDPYPGPILASAEIYDPVTSTFSSTGRMTTSRYAHAATLLNGKVLITGGANNSLAGILASAEVYDPATGAFTATGSMVTARQYPRATLLNNGKVLIEGGYNNSFLANAELYDPATQSFTDAGDMNTPRYLHAATLLNSGKILITGGYADSGPYLASAEVY